MSEVTPRPWKAAILWLVFLGPFFFGSYGFANYHTAKLPYVASLAFGWEQHIPFLPWTIVPYWSIDFFYAASVFLCVTRRELNTHALRLATATLVSVAGFLLFPLKFSFIRPETHGVFGTLFASLTSFDLPYNQAPSLHISLLWLLWLRYAAHTSPRWRWLVHGWFALIGVSVLTTWQHHFIDVVSGLAVGVVISYALPMPPHGWQRWQAGNAQQARRVGSLYLVGAAACLLIAVALGGWGWLLLWPAVALVLVALGYLALGPAIFQKDADGHSTLSAVLLLAPYRLGAWPSYRRYLPQLAPPGRVTEDVVISHYPRKAELAGMTAVLDLTAELPRSAASLVYGSCPLIDLVPPSHAELERAVNELERLRQSGPVLVHCALGLSRSATVVAAWLVASKREPDLEHAISRVRAARAGVVLHEGHKTVLRGWAEART
ncbi:phosphatase PAP2/dual specificity phosphatase family protein [Andreprevotia chitinilytica]|uniref:phosphatase PAP2/dual specificity phosphatase family protein n=1 Tax=Andreprevotia chitinilytica TaxID=396808 RepID=UPI000553C5D0|nr:phosphatase PAP2/dual specificity phosphatase family protein [Andreprevotia chitinilytica]